MSNREISTCSSRFHIIKIETGPLKRGRWHCRDLDEATATTVRGIVRGDMILVGPRSGSSSDSSGRPSFHIVTEDNGPSTGDNHHPIFHAASEPPAVAASKPPLPNRSHPPTTQPGRTVTQSVSSVSGTGAGKHGSSTSQHRPSIAQQPQQSCKSSTVIPSTASAALPPLGPLTTPGRFQVRPVDLNNAAAAILDSIVGSIQHDNHRLMVDAAGGRGESSAPAAVSAVSDGYVLVLTSFRITSGREGCLRPVHPIRAPCPSQPIGFLGKF